MRQTRPVVERILARVMVDAATGCWVFTGAINAAGYGVVGRGRRGQGNVLTHRAMHEAAVGPVPVGLDLDHLCRNRACCNPQHLEPVTRIENVARGLRAPGYGERLRTHCKHGHEFTPENTRRSAKQRYCRTCERMRYNKIGRAA